LVPYGCAIRFYQRIGRLLRKYEAKNTKYVFFISTPKTRDYNALPESLYALEYEGIDVAGIFERLPALSTEAERLADLVKEILEKTSLPSISYSLLALKVASLEGGKHRIRILIVVEEASWNNENCPGS